MAIQNDNTLVTKGDLKKIYQENIAPNLGGGINYYYTNRTGEELKVGEYSVTGSLPSGSSNTQLTIAANRTLYTSPTKRADFVVQNKCVLIPAGTTVRITATILTGPGESLNSNTDMFYYDYTHDTKIEYCPSIFSGDGYGYTGTSSTIFEAVEDTLIGIKCEWSNGTRSVLGSSSLIVEEVNRIVDPVKYVSNNSDLQETPVGNIISYMGNSVPKHYLACDGATYNIGAYPELEAFIIDEFGTINYFGGDGTTTWAVPDLQGEFLRGTGTNSHTNQGSGADVGTHQDGSTVTNPFTNAGDNICLPYNGWTQGNADSTVKTSVGYTNAKNVTKTATTTYPALKTVRPTNTSVKYCIKYESTFHAFFSNAAYKVSIAASVAASSAVQLIFDSSDIIGDSSLISGNSLVAPMNGWYSLGMNWSQSGSGDIGYYIRINGASGKGYNRGIFISDTLYLNKGDVITIWKESGSANSGRVNFCLLTSNYNPTIVNADSVYSENEQMIGYWTDGKPLYQKTLYPGKMETVGTIGTMATKEIDITNLSMDNIINATVAARNPNNRGCLFANMARADVETGDIMGNFRYYVTPGTNVIRIISTDTVTDNRDLIITLQYTKTTDTASSLQIENSLLLNRPDLWTVGTEYHFGGGLYGQRFTGNLSTTTATAWATVDSSSHWKNTTFKIFGIGGTIVRAGSGNAHAPFPYNDGTGLYQPFFGDSNGSKFMIQHKDSSASTNSYDVWVIYKK